MSDPYGVALLVYALLVPATLLVVSVVDAPYGRHARDGWGPTVPERWGWVVMESPSVLVALATFLAGSHRAGLVPIVLLLFWQLHYVQRTCVYPLLIRARDRRMPLLVAALAFAYTSLNAWTNFTWVGERGHYDTSWLWDPRFLVGAALFLGGFAINLQSDRLLRRLRAPGEQGYRIPQGFLYRWVSCPNYLGEIVEWCGWALMSWSVPGLLFALYTIANLAPRARAHHRWYQQTFPDYPPERRALVPGVW